MKVFDTLGGHLIFVLMMVLLYLAVCEIGDYAVSLLALIENKWVRLLLAMPIAFSILFAAVFKLIAHLAAFGLVIRALSVNLRK